ncbi:MAG: regulatory protein RecX [Myxococcaceae bacterium]|nr:regulatory protein RecX [Myxococcaceae bacterium]
MSSSAFDAAVRLLKGRAKSRAKLERALSARGYPAAEIEAALERVTKLGYVNDERYSEAKARTGLANGRSLEDVQRRLEADGVPAATAQAAARAAADEVGYDALAAARALLYKRRLTGVKGARFLAARGFSEHVIERLCGGDVDLEGG